MVIATTFVVLLTGCANALGPQLSGLLAPFPVFGLVLAAFTHHLHGAAGVARLLRGIVVGSLAFAGFFLVAGALLTTLPLAGTYALAAAAALGASAVAFYLTQQQSHAGPRARRAG